MTTYTPDDNSNTDPSEQQITDTIAAMNGAISKALREGAIAPDVMVRALERALNEAQLTSRPKEQVLFSISELMEGYWQHIEKRKSTMPTGFAKLDNVLSGGLETKRLKVLLGAPGSGKTTFVNQLVTNVANSGRPVLYVTSEDSPYTLLSKTIARVGNIPYTALLKGWDTEKEKIERTFIEYASENLSTERLLYLDATTGTTMAEVADIAQEHFEKYRDAEGGGPGVLVIDYLQRMARTQNQQVKQELRNMVSDLTDKLRSIAGSLDCCVIALASQNRASGYGKENASALSSAKESGDIEYTADVIMSIAEDKRDGEKRKTIQTRDYGAMKPWLLSIDKNRLGQPEAKIELNWFPERQKFGELEVTPS